MIRALERVLYPAQEITATEVLRRRAIFRGMDYYSPKGLIGGLKSPDNYT